MGPPLGNMLARNCLVRWRDTLIYLKRFRAGSSMVSGQGCSTLFTESHGKDGFETAECCGVAVLGDRIGLVDPQDIVGEAAHSCEDAGIFSDARRVFT